MGFLSGVLGAVKDDDAVKNYEKYINVDNRFDNVVQSLKNAIGKGSTELPPQLDKVRVCLSEYRSQVETLTDSVTRGLGELSNDISGKHINCVTGAGVKSLGHQLSNWSKVLGEIQTGVKNIETSNINVLDSSLETKLMHEIQPIKSTLTVLEESAGDATLISQMRHVDKELLKQREDLKQSVMNGCKDIWMKLNMEIRKVLGEIMNLEGSQNAQFKDISSTLKSTAVGLIDYFDNNYKAHVINKFNAINDDIGSIDKARNFSDNTKSKLRTSYNEMKSHVQEIGEGLNAENVKLETWKNKAVLAVSSAILRCNEMVIHLNYKRENNAFHTKLDNITTMAKELSDAYSATKSHLEEIAGKATKAFAKLQTLHSSVKGGIPDLEKFNDPSSVEWNVNNEIAALYKEMKQNIQNFAHELGVALKTAAAKAMWSNKSRPGVKHLAEALNGDRLGKQLKELGGVLTRGIPQGRETVNDLVYNLEILLQNFKRVMDDWNTMTPVQHDPLKLIVEDLDTKATDGQFKTQLGKLLKQAACKGIDELNKQIQQDGEVGELKNAKSDVKHVDDQKAKKQNSAINDTLEQLKSNLDEASKIVEAANCDDTIKIYLTDLQSMLMETGLTVKLKGKYLGESTNSFNNIKHRFIDLHNRISNVTSTEAPVIDKIIADLEEIPEVLRATQTDVVATLDKLKGLMQEKLNVIGFAVIEADNALKDAIDTIRKTLHKCHEYSKHAIEHFETQLIKKVEKTFIELTSQVQSLYATQNVSHLSALRSLVDQQLQQVQGIIEKDKRNGIKGLLRWMNENRGHYFVELKNTVDSAPQKPAEHYDKFKDISKNFEQYADKILDYIAHQNTNAEKPDVPTPESDNVKAVRSCLDVLLNYLQCVPAGGNKLYAFDHNSDELLSKLELSLNTLSPSFTSPSPLLAPLKAGLSSFTEQLGHAYVNRYSGKQFDGLLVETKQINVMKDGKQQTESKEELTPEGRNCAKVCLTIVEMVMDDFKYLREQCDSKWSTSRICSSRSLGAFMQRCGYRVAIGNSEQNGELQNKSDFTGSSIHGKLVGNDHLHVYNGDKDTKNALENIHTYLNLYYEVGHIAASLSTRRPCSISEILIWLTSLRHNPVYFNLTTASFDELFDKREKKEAAIADDDFIEIEDLTELSLAAYPQKVMHSDLHDALVHVIGTAPMILTTIVGYGDEFTTYAVDYHSNAAGFAIPSSASSCLSMLLELMRRLFPVFRFLHSRCSNLSSEYGWYHCAYGSNVESAGWQCKDHSKTDVDCLPRSPLMSYLRDSLPGHLPHQLTSVDCKSECKTCPKSTPGMPCITPLGFKGFSGSKRTGKDISNVLTKFFDKGVASCLLSLSPRPPISLPEHYAFALSFVKGWSHRGGNGLKNAINESIKSVSMELHESPNKVTDALSNAYGEARGSHGADKHQLIAAPNKDNISNNADVSSLSMSNRCDGANHCGPYLSTLYSDTYPYFGNKHCNAYMSWSVYLPWTFWQQLNSLYNAFVQIFCQDWGCTGCLRGDTCKKGTHGMLNPDVPGDGCKCSSIVGCKGVGPTLYQYGFTFQDVHCLISNQTKCFNLRNQVFSVLHSQYFKDLFKECDNFLWTIRRPFSYLVLALWLLSFLYLIHIMVIRLDLLHIKSHLNSPSSHRIAAQSLLAAGRVNKLNRVFYLQP